MEERRRRGRREGGGEEKGKDTGQARTRQQRAPPPIPPFPLLSPPYTLSSLPPFFLHPSTVLLPSPPRPRLSTLRLVRIEEGCIYHLLGRHHRTLLLVISPPRRIFASRRRWSDLLGHKLSAR
eukprot:763621-Hanusia_phi.AAC.5